MIEIDRYKCAYCGACVTVCSSDAIDLIGTLIEIKEEDCNSCEACVKICPIGALELLETELGKRGSRK